MPSLLDEYSTVATPSANEVVRFSVDGAPQTAGSKRAFALKRRDGSLVTRPNGSPVVNTIDDNAKSRGWKNIVRNAALQAFGRRPLLYGPLSVEMTFRRRRPSGHYGSRRGIPYLKDSAPPYPEKKPDVLKLARAAEDACTGVIWIDDAQIIHEVLWKVYVGPMDREGVDVVVSRMCG